MTGSSKKKRSALDNLDKDVKPVVKHVLSKELQIYYEKVTTRLFVFDLWDSLRSLIRIILLDRMLSRLPKSSMVAESC